MEIINKAFQDHNVRIINGSDGDVWFLAKDVCSALGHSNPRDAVANHVYAEDVARHDTPTQGGVQSMTYVNESGLYALVFGSRLQNGQAFKRWVTKDVLPEIRKTGSYGLTQPPAFNIPTTLSGALRLAAEQAETIEKQAAQIESAKPAIAFAERHASANNLLSIRAASKALRFPEQAFIAAMIRDGFLYRDQSGRIMPYANRQFAGLFDVTTGEANGHAYVQAKITPAGMQKMAERYASELGE